MTPPRSVMGSLSAHPLFARPWLRRGLFAVVILVCAALALFPERYRAAVTLTPTDPSSLGLGAALTQLGALNTVFGNQAAIEVALRISNSVGTRNLVNRRLNLEERLGLDGPIAVNRWIDRNVYTRTLRGGIVQIETTTGDAGLGRDIVGAIAEATRNQLSVVAQRQTAYKRDVLLRLVRDSNDRLANAQRAYDHFRLRTGYTDPDESIRAISSRIPALEATIRAKEVELSAARRFRTDQTIEVQQLIAERAELRRQLAAAQVSNPEQRDSVGRVVGQSTEADRLRRELEVARSLYYSYQRYLEGTAVEDLTSSATVRILEQPYVDTQRQFNRIPLLLGIAFLMLALGIEFYGFRPPVGDRRRDLAPAE